MRRGPILGAALLLSLGLAAEAAAGDGGTKAPAEKADTLTPPRLEVPKLEVPRLDVPQADLGTAGLSTGRKADSAGAGPTAVHFTIDAAHLARSFRTGRDGACVADGPLDGFRLPGVPATVEAFETCVRVTASAGVVSTLEARILDPAGREVASASGEVSFAGRSRTVDYVISWTGFPAPRTGRYLLVLRLGGDTVREFPIRVEGS